MEKVIFNDLIMTKVVAQSDVLVGYCPDRGYCYAQINGKEKFYFNTYETI